MKFPSHEAVNAYTGFLLRKVATAMFADFSGRLEPHGLHPMHFGMLEIIAAEAPISQQALGERIGIDPSTMVARMDVLEEQGLVERARRPDDRRAYEIKLTAEGGRRLERLREDAAAHSERFLAPLTVGEREKLHRLLLKLAEGVDAS